MIRLLALASLLLSAACDTPAAPATASVTRADTVLPVLRFERGFGPVTPTAPLVAGGVARIELDTARFHDIIRGTGSFSYFASAHHCYGYGCCEVAFPEVQVNYRFAEDAPWQTEVVTLDVAATTALGEGIAPKPLALDVALPADARRLEVWFSVPGYELHTWYCGCDTECQKSSYGQQPSSFRDYLAYDSAFGNNHVFPVSASAATVLTFGADWTESASGPLAAGETVVIRYDLARLPGCRGKYMGRDAFGVTMGYRFAPDEAPRFLGLSEHQADGTLFTRDTPLEVPAGGQLEAWFYVSSRWGCIQYDSDFGKNYRFAVE